MCTAFRQMREEGIQIGEERVNRLLKKLIEDRRINDIDRMVSDREYQKQLFQEYKI